MKPLIRSMAACVSLFMVLDGCTLQDHRPSLQNPSCQVLTLTVDSKDSGPDAYSRDETAMLDDKSVKIGKTSTDVYKFDEQNRLIESSWATYNYGGNGGSTTYEYTSDKIIMTSQTIAGEKQVHSFSLNKQGMWIGDGFKYNDEGFLIEKIDGDYTTTYTIENGNVVREEVKSTFPNSPVIVTLYEYDLSRPNLPNPYPYQGKASQNLYTKRTVSDGTTTSVYHYKYVFDESGKITRRYRSMPTGSYLVYDYTVTCR